MKTYIDIFQSNPNALYDIKDIRDEFSGTRFFMKDSYDSNEICFIYVLSDVPSNEILDFVVSIDPDMDTQDTYKISDYYFVPCMSLDRGCIEVTHSALQEIESLIQEK